MAWDFETDADFQRQLDWMDAFVREEIEPIGLIWNKGTDPFDVRNPTTCALIKPLQDEVRKRELWACHLTPDLGGQGYGQVKLALMNEILGRSQWASRVFGTQAPDTGNAEIIAHYGTAGAKSALPATPAQWRDRVLLLDDRTTGGLRSRAVPLSRVA
jgi:acyl-CoA dehydrogenase